MAPAATVTTVESPKASVSVPKPTPQSTIEPAWILTFPRNPLLPMPSRSRTHAPEPSMVEVPCPGRRTPLPVGRHPIRAGVDRGACRRAAMSGTKAPSRWPSPGRRSR